jgi:hypothetical protein
VSFPYYCGSILHFFVGLNSKQGFKGTKESGRRKLPNSPHEPSVRSYYTKKRGA